MASRGGRSDTNTTATTTSNTIGDVPQNRRLRVGNHEHTSSTSSRIPLVTVEDYGAQPPTAGNNSNVSEPFPSLPNERTSYSSLLQTRTAEDRPLSTVPSRTLQTIPSATASSQSRRRPIGIKRLSSQNLKSPTTTNQPTTTSGRITPAGRRRSTSAPQRPLFQQGGGGGGGTDGAPLRHSLTASNDLPAVVENEESIVHSKTQPSEYELQNRSATGEGITRSRGGSQRLRAVSDAARSAVSRLSNRSEDAAPTSAEYDDNIIDVLDVLDPEVSTLTTLTNVQNSLFVPDLGRWLNRRPTFELTKGPSYRSSRPPLTSRVSKPLPPTPTPEPVPPKDPDLNIPSDIEEEESDASPVRTRKASMASLASITSAVQEDHYAVLPHGVSLAGWSEEDKELLDDHVRHMLHSKREGFKRSMRAFGKYIQKPLGFFVTLYAVLITLFGLAWVLFLIGWIYVGDRQSYIINIIDNVLVALFAVVGDGLAPFRAVDTYHMGFIAYYHHLTEKLREKRQLPDLQDHNDLPETHETEVDVEASIQKDQAEFSVLKPEQQKKLEHHQEKFSKSHSFYKPHETVTHHAFPHHLFVAIVILLDLHSCLQITLGACTWGTNYHTRPKALTPTILSCSITVNITAGILIKVGDNKTRKKDVLTRMFRQELTEEAMKRVHKDREQGYGHATSREKDTRHHTIQEESEGESLTESEHYTSKERAE